jgi:hypothetical protein
MKIGDKVKLTESSGKIFHKLNGLIGIVKDIDLSAEIGEMID